MVAAGLGVERADTFSPLIASMAHYGNARADPVRSLMSYLGDRWSVLILLVLATGSYRYSTLRKLINALAPTNEKPISQRMLTLRLRTLEGSGMVWRHVTETIPPQVDYGLTPIGEEFLDETKKIIDWINVRYTALSADRA